MLGIGQKFPVYALKASLPVTSSDGGTNFPVLTDQSYSGKWKVYVCWPKDFTFVCPTEIIGFDEAGDEFTRRDTQLIGASTDSDFVHLACRNSRKDLGAVKYPWLADIKKELSAALGIVEPQEGVAYRATFIVDPDDVIRHVSVNDLSVGRNPQEVLRILYALQSGELTPCAWQPGQKTIKAA